LGRRADVLRYRHALLRARRLNPAGACRIAHLSPVAVGRENERWLGRIAAVLLVVTIIFAVTGAVGWVLTRQLVDLATKLPDYKGNIRTKLRSIKVPTGGAFTKFSETVEELKKDLPGAETPTRAVMPDAGTPKTSVALPPNLAPAAASFIQLVLNVSYGIPVATARRSTIYPKRGSARASPIDSLARSHFCPALRATTFGRRTLEGKHDLPIDYLLFALSGCLKGRIPRFSCERLKRRFEASS
jgi:hypothetical protein